MTSSVQPITTCQTHLSKQISKQPSNKRSKSLHGDGFLVESIWISLKPGDCPSPSNGRISEKRAQFSHILLSERRLVGDKGRLAESLGLRDNGSDAKGLCRKAGGDDYGSEELHGYLCSASLNAQLLIYRSAGNGVISFFVEMTPKICGVRGSSRFMWDSQLTK